MDVQDSSVSPSLSRQPGAPGGAAPGTGDQARASQEIHRLSALARADRDLAGRLQACSTPEQIVTLAMTVGCDFSVEALREESRRNLGAPHWPWGGQSRALRRTFFGESEPPTGRPGWRLGSWQGRQERDS